MVGRKNFIQRCKNQISKEEFKQKRLSAVYSIGTAKPYKGNQKFRICEDLQHILFQPDRKHHYELELIGVSKGYKDILKRLYARQELKDLPITYKLSNEYVWISFEEDKLYKDEFDFKKKKDRYCALDLNPNYIGYSIIDWKSSNTWKIIESGVYSFKQINDSQNAIKGVDSTDKKKIYWNNKRKHEVIEVAKNLIEKCCYFKVENFVIEDLSFKDSKQLLGTNLNRLCKNQWIRNSFINNLKKRCKIFCINFMEVPPQYSSFVGNIMFRSLDKPDMVLASIELSRRGYEFRHQYVLKDKPQQKNIVKIDINDSVFKDLFRESMEEFSVEASFRDVVDAYWHFKRNPKILYRVSLDSINTTNRYFRNFSSRHSRVRNVRWSFLYKNPTIDKNLPNLLSMSEITNDNDTTLLAEASPGYIPGFNPVVVETLNAGLPWTNPLKIQIGSDEHIIDTTINRGLMMLLNNDYYLDTKHALISNTLSSMIKNENALESALYQHITDASIHGSSQVVVTSGHIDWHYDGDPDPGYDPGDSPGSSTDPSGTIIYNKNFLSGNMIVYLPINYTVSKLNSIISNVPHDLNGYNLAFLFVVPSGYEYDEEDPKYICDVGDECIQFYEFHNGTLIIVGDDANNQGIIEQKTEAQIEIPATYDYVKYNEFFPKFRESLDTPDSIGDIIMHEAEVDDETIVEKTNGKMNKITFYGSALNDFYSLVSVYDCSAKTFMRNLKFESSLKPISKDSNVISLTPTRSMLPTQEKLLFFHPLLPRSEF